MSTDDTYPDPNRSFDDVARVWLTDEETFAGLPAGEIIVYGFIDEYGPVHSSTIQQNVSVKARTARDALYSLREAGLIEARSDPNRPKNDIYSIVD